jgi:hypothetical protein
MKTREMHKQLWPGNLYLEIKGKDSINTELRKMGCAGAEWIHLA